MLLLLFASVFLNGVNVDGLRSQKFDKCRSVRIDERGDVHLDCPAYEVQEQRGPAAQATAPSAVTRRYWLVSEESDSAAAGYDVDVFVNAKWIRRIKAGEPQMVEEITRFLQPGGNKVLFAARKRAEPAAKAGSSASFVKFTVGEGQAKANTVEIDNPLIECKRTAAETDDVNEEFTIQGR